MTWKPIGPEQMDGRVYPVCWDQATSWVAFASYEYGQWREITGKTPLSPSPTHYMPGVRPLGEAEAPQSEKTVRVRVAVAVDDTGDWAASGAKGMDDADAIESAQDCLNLTAQLSWITTDLPIPVAREIVASVEDA